MVQNAWLSTHLRAARPRVLAAVNRYFGDMDLAEDAFQDASLKAMNSWHPNNLPKDPVAWLVVASRNAGIDVLRKRQRETLAPPEDLDPGFDGQHPEDSLSEALDQDIFRDDLLRLFFTCCHPVLRADQQIALALKVVAGLSVAEIARAFLVQPKTMEQRITRAKKRLHAAHLKYETPDAAERSRRFSVVSNVIYLVFNEGYSASGGPDLIRVSLCDEAIRLARLLVRLFPEEPELKGLLCLCLIQHSRRNARLSKSGDAIMLKDQNRGLWQRVEIAEATILLETALRKGRPGPLQIEAAIAATHARAASFEDTDWAEIERLFRALEIARPSPVVTLNRAVAVSKLEGAASALKLLDKIANSLELYQGFHAAKASLHSELGERDLAKRSFQRALELSGTETEKKHLRQQLAEL